MSFSWQELWWLHVKDVNILSQDKISAHYITRALSIIYPTSSLITSFLEHLCFRRSPKACLLLQALVLLHMVFPGPRRILPSRPQLRAHLLQEGCPDAPWEIQASNYCWHLSYTAWPSVLAPSLNLGHVTLPFYASIFLAIIWAMLVWRLIYRYE